MTSGSYAATASTGRPAVEARALTKRIHDGREARTVVAEVDLSLARGEMLLLRGPSGSGKTTLLALLGAMLSPTSGEVLLDGEPTSRLRDRHRAEVRRRKVGFVFQDAQLLDGMTAHDNVLVPRIPEGVSAADASRASQLLERFGVGPQASTRARALSGGERQRVALARALLADPPLLLLDEPSAHLDPERILSLIELLRELAAEGHALVVATHDEAFAAGLLAAHPASRRASLAAGRLTA